MIKITTTLCLLAVLPLAAVEKKPIVAIYDLEGVISESGKTEVSLLKADLSDERPWTLFDLSRSLKKAAGDPRVKAVVVDADDASLGLAQLQELRRRIEAVRSAGKDVWLYTDAFTNASALLGSAANHFTLMPEGDVSFSGLYSESLYFKGLLDKAGVVADVIHIGDFKSFGEEYYRNGPSDFAMQQSEALIGGVFDQLVAGISEGRKVPEEEVRELIDRGISSPQQVKEAGLVDDLKHRTDFSAAVKATYQDAEFNRSYALPEQEGPKIEGLLDLFKLLKGSKEIASDSDYIAVVAFEGEISSESVAPVRRQILKLLKDQHAKALVLRVDSPGGSALASEVLWEATDEWKASGRPFVVSMGGVAASGGYYISSSADRIFAEGGTITGSIGVVGMKMVLGGAMEKWGITSHSTQRGKNAGLHSNSRPFSPEEAALVRDSMLQTYGTFKKRIEDGRGARLKGELESMAGGRVFTGLQALELGLVDEIGGLGEAIAHVAGVCDMDADAIKLLPEPKSMLEALFDEPEKPEAGDIVRMGATVSPVAEAIQATLNGGRLAALPKPAREAVADLFEHIESCEDGTVQMIGPDIVIPLK